MANAVQERTELMAKQGEEEKEYHSELMRLRQRWKLKRSGNAITGDLTYHSGELILINILTCTWA